MAFSLPSNRIIFLLLFIGCAALFATALVMQYQFEMHPCPLCTTQRIFVALVGIVGLVAALHNPRRLGQKVYGALTGLLALTGGGVAARHVWLQNLPEDQVPSCGPGLSYMFENFPLSQAFKLLFAGDGNCADVVWRFLGLSIPGWTLVSFIAISIACLFILFRRSPVN